MPTKLLGIGEWDVSHEPETVLSAPNLGSCLGISIYDPKLKRGAMMHCMLPLSQSNPEKAKDNPGLYVDTGFVMMIQRMIENGSNKRDLIITVAGGSNINDANNVFEIGKKNYTILKKLLWKNSLLLKGEHCGSNVSRTISLSIASGDVFVKVSGEIVKLA